MIKLKSVNRFSVNPFTLLLERCYYFLYCRRGNQGSDSSGKSPKVCMQLVEPGFELGQLDTEFRTPLLDFVLPSEAFLTGHVPGRLEANLSEIYLCIFLQKARWKEINTKFPLNSGPPKFRFCNAQSLRANVQRDFICNEQNCEIRCPIDNEVHEHGYPQTITRSSFHFH